MVGCGLIRRVAFLLGDIVVLISMHLIRGVSFGGK